jgi:secreted PhoX family phosphatase
MRKDISSRRDFLKKSGIVGIGFWGMRTFLAGSLTSCTSNYLADENTLVSKYGPLEKDPAGVFDLPAGFNYRIISRRGEEMNDGMLTPDKPDGMATFAGRGGKVILVRNHELLPDHFGPFGVDSSLINNVPKKRIYDVGKNGTICKGGTTTLVIDEATLEVKRSYLSLVGTIRNCAGGPTPWNSWITCEEYFAVGGKHDFLQDHGYNFEVPASEKVGLVKPVPLKEMGRFRHEAVCVDPRTSIVYQTEDMGDGLIYRYLPNQPGQLHLGGRLQALVVKEVKSCDTRNWKNQSFPINQPMKVAWIDLEDVDANTDDLRMRGFHQGAAVFGRGEGMWFDNNECYFACTAGGKKRLGQVFRYIPSPYEGTPREKEQPGTLELFLEPNDGEVLRWCDNLTVAPWGDLILAEDNPNPFLVGVTPDGQAYKLGHNVGFQSELAGCVFSPSGKTLFVNIQHAGLTLAIQGPWQKKAVGEEVRRG